MTEGGNMGVKMFEPPEIPEKYMKNFILKMPFVRLGVLHVLSKEPSCGNKIAEMMSPKVKGSKHGFPHKLNPNVLYPLLYNLEKEGFISGKWEYPSKRTRRIYSITPKGKIMLVQLKKAVKPKIEEALKLMKNFAVELFDK